jgi:hypothetical protein
MKIYLIIFKLYSYSKAPGDGDPQGLQARENGGRKEERRDMKVWKGKGG